MADPREDYGDGVIVLENADDPVPQPKIVTASGDVLTPEQANELLAAEGETSEQEEEDLEDLSDLDDPLPGETAP